MRNHRHDRYYFYHPVRRVRGTHPRRRAVRGQQLPRRALLALRRADRSGRGLMTAPRRDPLALLVGVIDQYGQPHVIAEPVTITPEGELHSPHRPTFGSDRDGDLADLK